MNRRVRRRLLIIATAAVWGLVIAMSVSRFQLAAKLPMKIALTTAPTNVKIKVDGEYLFRGRYTSTPVKITLAPGRHRLKIDREGYGAHIINVEGLAGETIEIDQVILEPSPDAEIVAVTIEAPNEKETLFVSVDDGFAKGELPIQIVDLLAQRDHYLVLHRGGPDSPVAHRCRFRLRNKPTDLVVMRRHKKLRVPGCKALKPKKRRKKKARSEILDPPKQ